MSEIKQYDTEVRLEAVMGTNHYGVHIHAMTAENLHSKSDIAVELAWRDLRIEQLIAQLEAAQKELFDFHNQEFQQRLANAEHQLYMKDLAIHNIKASRVAQFRKRLAAEAALSAANEKLSKPVMLPELVVVNISGKYPIEVMYASKVKTSIKAAGFTVEGE
ncbi:TPA: hypothetical protein ACVNUV_004387 [Yersinia enterocolitica]|nr:hypothetical protein [Yersinia enterocolitica]HEN3329481.1 hypothetical protein [Yersinia enterocolitica]HEN3407678.1 hypothetical protein [Yersinia enterocolitica]HEN3414907.1 hypothetical protein [Yersinia enterocolitica]